MKKMKNIAIFSLMLCSMFSLAGCNDSKQSLEDIQINQNDSETHYLKFMENNAEILRLVVLKDETYDDLLPYFPTLTEEPGYIKYWDGDYMYTDYSKENQFKIYDDKDFIIEIYAYAKKID